MFWQRLGNYEYEVGMNGDYTGWFRCVGGRLRDGRWPVWHIGTGEEKI